MCPDITGVILCGGKSSRMNTDKALLKLGESTIIEIIYNKLKNIFQEVLISANDLEKFKFLNAKIIKDIYADRGPLAGIHSALKYSESEKIFVTACDIPLVPTQLISYLLKYKSDKEIILPKLKDRIQFLCGIYSKQIIPNIEQIFNSNDKKGAMFELLEYIPAEIIEVDEFEFANSDIFLNVNTPEDFYKIKKIFNSN
jgi:molybdopterin-guanine dinucleotide biosynthesis protein A